LRGIQLDLTKAKKRVSFQEALSQARKIYWNLIFEWENIELGEEILERNQVNLRAANKRIHGGLATKADRYEFELKGDEAEQESKEHQLQRRNSEISLRTILGLAINKKISVPHLISHKHNAELLSQSVEAKNRAEIERLMVEARQLRKQAQKLGRWWTPSADVYGEYALLSYRSESEFPENKDRFETVVGAKLTIPFFDGFSGQNEKSSLLAQAQGLDYRIESEVRGFRDRLLRAKEQLWNYHRLIESFQARIKKGKKYLELTLSEYRRGVKNSPDVLGATERFFDLRHEYSMLRKNYELSKADLLELLSK